MEIEWNIFKLTTCIHVYIHVATNNIKEDIKNAMADSLQYTVSKNSTNTDNHLTKKQKQNHRK